ncbi:MAG: hypothetical protein HN730_11220, partial [Bdellovibrionales bacterium]|nr:hypothetical protein [Bdellovibrionales bacterium]
MRTLVSITILLFIACRLGYGVEREQQALVLLQQAGGSYLAGNYTKSKE